MPYNRRVFRTFIHANGVRIVCAAVIGGFVSYVAAVITPVTKADSGYPGTLTPMDILTATVQLPLNIRLIDVSG